MSNKNGSAPLNEIHLNHESNPQYNKDKNNLILLSNDNSNYLKKRQLERELLSKLKGIFTYGKGQMNVYLHFLDVGASFSSELVGKCDISEQSVHRLLRKMRDKGLIQPVAKSMIAKKAGPKLTIYRIDSATKQEIQNAFLRSMQSASKFYGYVLEVYQKTLTQILDEQIQYSKIVGIAKRCGSYGYHFTDIAEEIARKLTYEGIRVLNYREPEK